MNQRTNRGQTKVPGRRKLVCPRFTTPKATDSEILAWAAADDMVILTHDLDFTAMLAVNRRTSPSVVQIRCEDVNPDGVSAHV